jgi:transposase InsO family protein
VLVELGVVEQRHAAVLEVLGGLTVLGVARRYGVSRQTVHRWLRLYARFGIGGLADRSCRPATCPHRMAPAVEARIVELRRAHPGWGPRTLRHRLGVEGIQPLPGRSSIYRCLLRHGLIDPQRRRRKREDYRRWERSRPMELWQMDVMGGVRLSDGRELKIITGLDDHSRFCICATLVPRATARPVCEALITAMAAHGIPEQVLTDNGKVFTGRFGVGKGEVLFDRLCREHGVRHLLTAPHSPTTTGKVERFHKTVRRDFLGDRVFVSLEEAQAALDAWVTTYNSERPHQSLGMEPPARRFSLAAPAPALRLAQEVPDEPSGVETGPPLVTRRVSREGRISLGGFAYHVGTWLAGETVEAALRDGLLEVSHRGVLIASHARRHPLEAEPRLWQRPRAPRPRPQTSGVPVMRKVGSGGTICFAGADYRVGNRHRGQQVEVRLVGDSVQISQNGKLIRTHAAHHDRSKEHGAFANPRGRPSRINGYVRPKAPGRVTQLPEPLCNAGGGT